MFFQVGNNKKMNKDNNMKRAFFLTVIVLTLISCGESSKAPINLPEYKIVNTEIPRVSSNGYISPTQNLVYSIEIAHPLQKDSLELIQDYFIKKGEAHLLDFEEKAGFYSKFRKILIETEKIQNEVLKLGADKTESGRSILQSIDNISDIFN